MHIDDICLSRVFLGRPLAKLLDSKFLICGYRDFPAVFLIVLQVCTTVLPPAFRLYQAPFAEWLIRTDDCPFVFRPRKRDTGPEMRSNGGDELVGVRPSAFVTSEICNQPNAGGESVCTGVKGNDQCGFEDGFVIPAVSSQFVHIGFLHVRGMTRKLVSEAEQSHHVG